MVFILINFFAKKGQLNPAGSSSFFCFWLLLEYYHQQHLKPLLPVDRMRLPGWHDDALPGF